MHKYIEESESASGTRQFPGRRTHQVAMFTIAIGFAATLLTYLTDPATAQPQVNPPSLEVRTVVGGLVTPISMAFLGSDDFLVLEKNTGRVQRVVNGMVQSTVLDLAVNFGSERGLLGIALHPQFSTNPSVYLYWTESTTGSDTDVLANTPLLGNRVDRYLWDGTTLTFAQNIIHLRALQPLNPPHETREFGNHDGGVLRFGPDQKLYVVIGDTGRRGQLQNLPDGPFGPGQDDDQFGGPEPDDAHFTGVILRLEDDGSAPSDNPFFEIGGQMGGPVGANIQKIYAYGIRNTFGMDFDPKSGDLWVQVHGDDSFDELQRVVPGLNSGWIQVIGPIERISQFKSIETDSTTIDPVTGQRYFGLQQARWSPANIADTPEEALSRLFMLPGSQYRDPEFSWKFAVAPAAIGFVRSRSLGPQFEGNLILGASRTFLADGYLFRFKLTGNGRRIATDDPRLRDRVADNNHKFDILESESLLFGSGFGVGTDIQTGPNGNLYVVSLSNGAIYEIRKKGSSGTAVLPGGSVDPAAVSIAATGTLLPAREDYGLFVGSSTLRLKLHSAGPVTIGVYDVAGRLVRSLADGEFAAGEHEFSWDGQSSSDRALPAGIYFVQIQANHQVQFHKIVQIR